MNRADFLRVPFLVKACCVLTFDLAPVPLLSNVAVSLGALFRCFLLDRQLGCPLHDVVARAFNVNGRVTRLRILLDRVPALCLDRDLALALRLRHRSFRRTTTPFPRDCRPFMSVGIRVKERGCVFVMNEGARDDVA